MKRLQSAGILFSEMSHRFLRSVRFLQIHYDSSWRFLHSCKAIYHCSSSVVAMHVIIHNCLLCRGTLHFLKSSSPGGTCQIQEEKCSRALHVVQPQGEGVTRTRVWLCLTLAPYFGNALPLGPYLLLKYLCDLLMQKPPTRSSSMFPTHSNLKVRCKTTCSYGFMKVGHCR
jgi:hypothetical protein